MLRRLLGCALCAALWVIVAAAAPAAITQEGGVSITTSAVQVGAILDGGVPSGDGKLWVTSPSTLTSTTLSIGSLPTSLTASGAVYVQGGTVTSTGSITVGRGGNGRLEVTDGGFAHGGVVRIGGDEQSNPMSFLTQGVAIVDGVGSKLRYNSLIVGASSDGQLRVTGGGTLVSGATTTAPVTTATIGRNAGSTGLVVVDGTGSLWQHNSNMAIGQGGPGMLHITRGGVVTAVGGNVGGEAQGAFGSVVIDGAGSRWSLGMVSLGNQSQWSSGEILVTNGGMLDQGTSPQVRATLGQSGFGRVVVSGPTSRWVHPGIPLLGSANGGMGEIVLEDGTQFTSGGIDLQGGRVVVDGPTTRWTSTGQINFGTGQSGPATIELRRGATLNMPNFTSLTIGSNGRLLLDGGRLLASSTRGALTNNGLIQGGGVLQVGPMTNNGRIVVGAGEKLQITAQFFSNGPTAVIEVNNGELELGTFSSMPGGRVIASGATLRGVGLGPASQPWQGKGSITFAAGRNRVFGAYSNATTVVANGAELEFYDTVTISALFNAISVSTGGELTAFGPFRGSGVGGAGKVFLENVIQPGNNGAGMGVMTFGGDVYLGGVSQLEIQVGGDVPAADYDALVAQGAVSLGGALKLTAVGELNSPTALLPIVQAGDLSGVFSSIPAIGANIGAGVRFHGVTYDYANDEVLVSLTQGLPADFNLDGVQDGADLLTWQRALGTACEPGMGADATCDGAVDAADLAVWQAAMAAASGLQAGVQTVVPEPTTLGLALVALGAAGRLGGAPSRRRVTTA